MKHALLIAAVSLFLGACAGTAGRKPYQPPGRPDWTEGPSVDYPSSRFLTGAGSAGDPEAAKDAARGEIAKVFSSRITAATYSSAAEGSFSGGGLSVATASQEVASTVRVAAQKALEGVEIVRAWRDPADGRHYALAALDRAKARGALLARLSELDGRGETAARELAAANDRLPRARAALKAQAVLKGREVLIADLRVISPGTPAESPFNAEELRTRSAAALAALDAAVSLKPEPRERVLAELRKALAALGLQTGGKGEDLLVACEASFEALEDPDPRSRWKWQRGAGSAKLTDARTGREFLAASVTAKEAAASEGEALAKAETALGKKLGAEITKGLTSFLEQP